LPNATATILTSKAAVTVAQGGTGRATATTAYGIIAAGTTATGVQQTIAPGTSGQFLGSNGTSALPSMKSIAIADVTSLQTTLNSKVNGTTRITVATTAPASPAVGDLWVDTN